MRRLALVLVVLSLTSVMADRAYCGRPSASTVAILNEVSSSGVTGKASFRPSKTGGTSISMSLQGLQYDVEYVAFYHVNSTCDLEADYAHYALIRFRGGKRGSASFTVDVADNLTQIHSVSVNLGNYLGLVACGPLN